MDNGFDKPSVRNTASLLNPVSTPADEKAEQMRNKVLLSKSVLPAITGRVWYISSDGDDSNAGNSPESAWGTLKSLNINKDKIQSGDAVLLKRGGVYRGSITAVSGVFYGAYGEGEKPCVYVSEKNYAQNTLWEDVGDNVWKIEMPNCSVDAGIVVFNHGEGVGLKKNEFSLLKKNGDFYYENKALYLKLSDNPAKIYKSIEIGDLVHAFLLNQNVSNVAVDNITFKYGGGMAIQGGNGTNNIRITNCEIGWFGGCYLPGFGNGKVRFGNGIEFWNGCNNILVDNCWIYQIYDSGFSHQGNGIFVEKNIKFTNNLVEYTSFASIEYWTHDANKNSMENILYKGNILRFAGMGWGDIERPDVHGYHILSTGKMDHKCKNFIITENILDTSAKGLIKCTSKVNTLPAVSGNTYIQSENGLLGCYGNVDAEVAAFSDAKNILPNVFCDKTAKIICC